MTKKYSELEKKEKSEIERHIWNIEGSFENCNEGTTKSSSYGMCSSCKYFQYTSTEFKVLVSRCGIFEIKLSDTNPVIKCSSFDKKGELSLTQMLNMAYIIETQRKKVGFLDEE